MFLFFHSMLCLNLGLGLASLASAEDRLPINKILKHPTDYQAQVVTVEGHARAVSSLPVHRGTPSCGGGSVYDSQVFALQDKSGTIGISTTGACRPNVIKPVVQSEHLRVRGMVMAEQNDPKGTPLIYAHSIDRVAP
ncbi:hypothetical protein [Nitrospira sp. BLG_2]|uniref:hypothetical protein n=1 Tax=Nitrospira sp. BLG_2 TaxID=3397507 RepID=UPI003B995824